jgi:hypothetical protein
MTLASSVIALSFAAVAAMPVKMLVTVPFWFSFFN